MNTEINIDTELASRVARLRTGDADEQGVFFRNHWSEIYAICARILGDGPDACDVTVDILCDFLFDYVKSLKKAQAMRSYLRLMAVRRSLRLRNKRGKSVETDSESLPDQTGCSPEHAASMVWWHPRLTECLSRLTPKAQQVVRLRYGQDLANERIGEMVGGSKQYIGRLLSKSLGKLKECLEAEASGRQGGSVS